MKLFTKLFYWVLCALTVLLCQESRAQSILDPTDSVYTYNSKAAAGTVTNPNLPALNSIGKWIRTVRLNWNTNQWKAYVFNGPNGVGVPFRLLYPKSYNPNANDGKTYPMIVFYHGVGEGGPVTDNEYSLANGGPVFTNAENSGAFDGYILVFQSTGSWGPNHNLYTTEVIDYMVAHNKLSPFRVLVNGLSAGGYNSWNFLETYPQYTAGALPMSGVSLADNSYINTFKYTPIWLFQGGLDGAPDPGTAANVVGQVNAAGGNIKYTLYPNLGHGTWNQAWSEPDFFPFCVRQYSSNPWTLFGRTQFCPGDPINVTLGVAPGYDGYQWRMNGSVISSATTNSINVTQLGTYDCRVLRNGNWSDWSHTPVVIATKQPTVTPPITVSGLMSKVIPALDNNGVNIKVPSGYASYVWQKVGNSTTIGTDSSIYVTTPGDYIAKVTEQYGCSSSFSTPFTVVSASGPNKPDAASGLVAAPLSQTSVLLNWSQNPSPVYNETNFEVYQATQAGGPYKLVGITGADASKDTVTGLNGGTKYYFVVRAVNNSGASAASNETNTTTIADVQPPTSPAGLTITGTTRTSVTLSWTASTDNVGVTGYYVYVNGVKSYSVPAGQTTFTVNGLNRGQSYAFSVKATDLAGNFSAASNQVSGVPLLNGLTYNYYNLPAGLTALPDFTQYSPSLSGNTANISLTPATSTTNYGFLWTGYIIIPTTGTYNFRTTSDDGSMIFLGPLNGTASPYSFSGTPIVNNDGAHGSTTVTSANQTLTAGIYPIAITYLQITGGASMAISWKIPGSGSYVTIPNTAFSDAAVTNGSVPNNPSNLVATTVDYQSINLTWVDNSTNESGFEIWRSNSLTGSYTTVGTVGAGVTSFTDNGLTASTQYFYKVRAINTYGQSDYAYSFIEAEWKFNNNYVDSTGNGHTLTTANSPTFDAANKAEGAYSVKLNGTNQNITIANTSSFLQEAYAQRTIACWIKPSQTTGTYRQIFDIGGSDNGLALFINNNNLIAAVASGSTRNSITTSFTSTAWNHVAVVYNGDSLLLYLNGSLVASNTSLSFHALKTTTNGARIGQVNGTNALNITNSTYFGGWVDDFTIINSALSTSQVNALKNLSYASLVSSATTNALPAIPAAPSALAITAHAATTANLGWTNTAVNATNIQVYRSSGNNQAYVLLTTLPGNATSYADNGLFPNATYYYHVNAVNAGGTSAYSNEVNVTTADIPPVVNKVSDTSIRYGTTTSLTIGATTTISGALTFTGLNLPSFAQLTDNHNGTATLTLTPAVADAGNYSGIGVIVTDAFGGADTTKFALSVNNNYAPVIDSIGNYTLSENDILSIPLSAHEQNAANALTFTVSNVPNNYTIVNGAANGQATLQLHPNYAAAGVYTVQVTAHDQNTLNTTRTFTLTVLDKDPTEKTYVRFSAGDTITGVWNNVTGVTSSNFFNSSLTNTGMGLSLPSWWWPATFPGGPTTGNNSGVYPDAVLKDYYFFAYYGGPDTVNAVINGMDTTRQYNLTFFASSAWTGAANNGSTRYRVGNQSVTLAVQNNTQNTVTLSNLKPAADGTITFTMSKADANTPVGYINALVITKLFDDSTAPAAPRTLTAQNISGSGVGLNWVNTAYNAQSYQVYRSTSASGTFSQVGTVGSATSNFTDTTVSGGVTYYYKVQASNGYGLSAFTDPVSILTTDRIPKLAAIADVTTSAGQTVTVNITATDDPTDHVTLTASGLPSFATFADNGNGTGTVTINPGAGTNGTYNGITITATDNSDSSSTATFNIYVVEQNISSTYVNFTDTTLAARPWNNMSGIPFPGTVLSNLTDDSNTPTGISVTLQDGFQGNAQVGTNPNNGTNIYPATVLKSGFFTNSTAASRILITGLNPAKAYNFVLFNSYSVGLKCLTNFTINGQTLSLDASFNSNKTVQFNGITSDANGTVTISVQKATGQDYAIISSLVIQAYDPAVVTLMSPSNLMVTNSTRTSVSLQWQDRASSETGYQIWRSQAGNSNYSLLTTVAANTTSYTDNNLTSDVTYYYTVRAVKGSAYSDYSNAVSAHTYASQIYIAFDDGTLSPKPGAPWNNLNQDPQLNWVWNNFLNDQSVVTNVGMVQTARWEGLYGGGLSTGNNSGVYPDNVMIQSFGMFAGESSNVTLTGLDLSKTYDFTFFASATGVFDATAYYTVNGSQPVYLNANQNTKGTVTLYGIKPNADGTALVTITAYQQAQFALIGAMVVSGYTATSLSAPTAPVTTQTTQTSQAQMAARLDNLNLADPDNSFALLQLNAYPNPFDQSFTLSVPAKAGDNVIITMMDASGRPVYQQRLENLYQGNNQVQVQPAQQLAPGIYFLKVLYQNRNEQKTLRVMRR